MLTGPNFNCQSLTQLNHTAMHWHPAYLFLQKSSDGWFQRCLLVHRGTIHTRADLCSAPTRVKVAFSQPNKYARHSMLKYAEAEKHLLHNHHCHEVISNIRLGLLEVRLVVHFASQRDATKVAQLQSCCLDQRYGGEWN